MLRNSILCLCLLLSCIAYTQVNIIPRPVQMKVSEGSFRLNASTSIHVEDIQLQPSADFFSNYLETVYGIKILFAPASGNNTITLKTDKTISNKEMYRLRSTENTVNITGGSAEAVFYGMQTLIQLLPVEKQNTLLLPIVQVEDFPRFQYRGLHLDVSRHFFPVSFIKKYIDYLAYHKMNFFHWHLTDDQGWRIEIKKYPKLTTVGAYRNGTIIGRYPGTGNDNIRHGGFYSQNEVKEIVAYAASRYITVIPEIEMPGHASAALAAYSELGCTGGPYAVEQTFGVFDDVFCAGNLKVFEFLEDVVDEIIPLFPGKYLHIGGDECPKTRWKECPRCQQRIKENNLSDEYQLQSYFIQRMEKYINSKGKTIIGWDEILEGGLAPNAVVMSWRGEEGGVTAAKSGHYAIMTLVSHVYLDYSQTRLEDSVTIGGYTTVQKTYGYEPVPEALTEEESKYILGAQGNLWTEYIKNPSKAEYQIFPRASALSEVLWSPKALRDWNNFKPRLLHQFQRYELWGTSYSKALFDLKDEILPDKDSTGIVWLLSKPVEEGKIMYAINNSPLKEYTAPVAIAGSDSMLATLQVNGKPTTWLRRNFRVHKAVGRKVFLSVPPSSYYPGLRGAFGLVNGIRSEKGRESDEWLGWNGQDVTVLIDLGEETNIRSVMVHLLGQEASHIHFPASMQLEFSTDGVNFSTGGSTTETVKTEFQMGLMGISFSPVKTKFVKINLKNFGEIPAGKPGAGNKAWLFADEIYIY